MNAKTQQYRTRHDTTHQLTRQYTTTRQDTKQNDNTRHVTTQHNTAHHWKTQHWSTRLHTRRNDSTRHGKPNQNTTRHDTTQHGAAQHNKCSPSSKFKVKRTSKSLWSKYQNPRKRLVNNDWSPKVAANFSAIWIEEQQRYVLSGDWNNRPENNYTRINTGGKNTRF